MSAELCSEDESAVHASHSCPKTPPHLSGTAPAAAPAVSAHARVRSAATAALSCRNACIARGHVYQS
eukprot:6208563-Pleurochrysis_carterae.AAC.2